MQCYSCFPHKHIHAAMIQMESINAKFRNVRYLCVLNLKIQTRTFAYVIRVLCQFSRWNNMFMFALNIVRLETSCRIMRITTRLVVLVRIYCKLYYAVLENFETNLNTHIHAKIHTYKCFVWLVVGRTTTIWLCDVSKYNRMYVSGLVKPTLST